MIKLLNNFKGLYWALSGLFLLILIAFYLATIQPSIVFFASPNFDERPAGTAIDTIVLHATQIETLEKVIKYFSMEKSKLSSHYTIGKDGRVVQHVKDEMRAWHAGESQMLDGRHTVNNFSIGIELVNLNDGDDVYPDVQIVSLKKLIDDLSHKWPIKFVVTHAEIATPPGRKNDPLGFDMNRLK